MSETILIAPEVPGQSPEKIGDSLEAAEMQLDVIEGQVLEENPAASPHDIDKAVGDFVAAAEFAMPDGSPEEVRAAESAGLRIIGDPRNSDKTAGALDTMPVDSLAPALRALEEGRGRDAVNLVMATLNGVVHDQPPDIHEHHLMVGRETNEVGEGANLKGNVQLVAPAEEALAREAADQGTLDTFIQLGTAVDHGGDVLERALNATPEALHDPIKLVEWVRAKRDVNSRYRGNKPEPYVLDRMILAAMSADDTRIRQLGEMCISDNESAERIVMGFAVGIDDGDESSTLVDRVAEVAKRNEQEATDMYAAVTDKDVKNIGFSAAELRSELWPYVGDRRLALRAYLGLAEAAVGDNNKVFAEKVAREFLPVHNGGYERNDTLLAATDLMRENLIDALASVQAITGQSALDQMTLSEFIDGDAAMKETIKNLSLHTDLLEHVYANIKVAIKDEDEVKIRLIQQLAFRHILHFPGYGVDHMQPGLAEEDAIVGRIQSCSDAIDLGVCSFGDEEEMVSRIAIQRVFSSDDPRQYATMLNKLKDEGVLGFEAGDTMKATIFSTVIDSVEPMEQLEKIKRLSKEGLFAFDTDDLLKEAIYDSVISSADSLAQLQKIKSLERDGLLQIIGTNGPLAQLSQQLFKLCVNSDSPEDKLNQVKNFVSGEPKQLWWLNLEYAKLKVGETRSGSLTPLAINEFPTAIPKPSQDMVPRESFAVTKWEDLNEDERIGFLVAEADGAVARPFVHFNELRPEFRDALLAQRLMESIADSRDAEKLATVSERNLRRMQREDVFVRGDLIHSSGANQLRQILRNGILCGETIGMQSKIDAYPFNVDFIEVTHDVASRDSFQSKLDSLDNKGFGDICIIVDGRNHQDGAGAATTGGMTNGHRLVLGAVPSTEICAIALRSDDSDMAATTKEAIIEHGSYIPVYDANGNLLLDFDEFESLRDDGNYTVVMPEIVDQSFKRQGSQAGSNEGAWFYSREKGGDMESWYVKFGDASREATEHTWTELLADKFYAAVTPQLAVETKAVIIDGRFARAAKKIDLDENTPVSDAARNEGFVMDCLLGNWDAVYNTNNLVMDKTGHARRIDTGNSFDFRAKNGKKDAAAFGGVVAEIEFGNSERQLSGGMRQMYPGLTDDQIREQVRVMNDVLTDAKIEEMINTIRRSSADRIQLIATVKARRDYLADRFLE